MIDFTQGPWEIASEIFYDGRPYGFNIAGEDGYHVAKVSSRDAIEGKSGVNLANAKMIAASPEMYEVLQSAFDYIRAEETFTDAGLAANEEMLQQISAVLNKIDT